jgi:hypothetical protein
MKIVKGDIRCCPRAATRKRPSLFLVLGVHLAAPGGRAAVHVFVRSRTCDFPRPSACHFSLVYCGIGVDRVGPDRGKAKSRGDY